MRARATDRSLPGRLGRHVWRSSLFVGFVAAISLGCGASDSAEEPTEHSESLLADDATPEEILAKLQTCRKASNAPYAKDVGGSSTIDVCKLKNAVFFKGDLDIDCDGKESSVCNSDTDHSYQSETAASDSRGEPLDAAKLPFIVVPGASSRWSYGAAGIGMGTVGAVIYQGKMEYGIVGDVGPRTIIGEASYAMAKRLGINPNPSTGGTDSGVTYVIFTGTSAVVSTNEDHAEAVRIGKRRAAQLLAEN